LWVHIGELWLLAIVGLRVTRAEGVLEALHHVHVALVTAVAAALLLACLNAALAILLANSLHRLARLERRSALSISAVGI